MKRLLTLLFVSIGIYAFSADFYVLSTADSGPTTLRQAVLDAQPGDNIFFDVTDTITLTTNGIEINKDNLTIDGGAGVVITQTANARIMTATAAVTSSLNIRNITFTGANYTASTSGNAKGAAFRVYANAKGILLENCNFENNRINWVQGPSGGIIAAENGSTVTLDNCNFWNNVSNQCSGSALFLLGSATVIANGCSFYNNSTIGVNSGARGSLIHSWAGTIILDRCTISNNSAVVTGNSASGQGTIALAQGATGDITNCTITNNIMSTPGTSTSDGGAGLFISHTSQDNLRLFEGNIIAGNIYTNSTSGLSEKSDFFQQGGAAFSGSEGYNLMDTVITDQWVTGSISWQSSDIVEVDANIGSMEVNAQFAATIPLLCTSPGRNSGNPTLNGSFDQLGNSYNQLGGVDRGAREMQGPLPTAITLTTSQPICPGNLGQATISNFNSLLNYTWSVPNLFRPKTNQTLAGDHYVVVSDEYACTDTTFYTIIDPSEIVINPTVTNICNGSPSEGNISITPTGGAGGYTYDWDIDGNGDFDDASTITNLSPGSYKVAVQDANECVVNGSYEIVDATLLTFFQIPNSIKCYGDSTTIMLNISQSTGSNIQFDWSNDGTGDFDDVQNLKVPAGSYTIVTKDEFGCIDQLSPSLTQPDSISVSALLQDDNGGSNGEIDLTVSGGTPTSGGTPYSFLWSNNETTEDIDRLSSGNYAVVVTDDNGCEKEKNFTVGLVSGLTEKEGELITLYPVPASDFIHVSTEKNVSMIEVMDLNGNVLISNSNQNSIEVSNISSGMYFIKVSLVNGDLFQDQIVLD